MPASSRMTRRRIISISMSGSSVSGGAILSRSLTIGNGSRSVLTGTFGRVATRRRDVAAPARHARLLAHPRTAAEVVLAVAIPAHDAKRAPVGIGRDDRVQPVGLAGAAEIFDGSAGAKRWGHRAMVANPARPPRESARRYTRNVGKLLDSVPFSGIIRIRDMMYSRQGSVSPRPGGRELRRAGHGEARRCTRRSTTNHSHYLQTTGVPRLLELLVEKLRDGTASRSRSRTT